MTRPARAGDDPAEDGFDSDSQSGSPDASRVTLGIIARRKGTYSDARLLSSILLPDHW
jgi:hypothetical protein